jgi:MFS family permease
MSTFSPNSKRSSPSAPVMSAGFATASLAAALAVSPAILIGCRPAQGIAAALLIPQGLGIIRDVFAPAGQGRAFAVFGPVIGLSAVLGPIVGGALVSLDAFGTGWRLIFLANLPLAVAAAIGAARIMPESSAPRAPRPDGLGTLLCAAAMGLLVYPLIQGRQAGWPLWTYPMMAASVVAAGLLAGWSRRRSRRGHGTLIETSVFRHRGYSAGLACVVVFFAGMTGTLLTLTLYLQSGEHFSAIHAGLTLAPFAVGSAAGAVTAATVIVPRLGRGALQIAAALIAAGTWWLDSVIAVHGLATTTVQLIPAQLVLGAGTGMLISPLFDFILASVRDHEVGSASGVLNAVQQLASAIGVAAIGTVFFAVLGHSGFVAAISQCLKIELVVAAVLFALAQALPRTASGMTPMPVLPDPAGAAAGRLPVPVVPGADRDRRACAHAVAAHRRA